MEDQSERTNVNGESINDIRGKAVSEKKVLIELGRVLMQNKLTVSQSKRILSTAINDIEIWSGNRLFEFEDRIDQKKETSAETEVSKVCLRDCKFTPVEQDDRFCGQCGSELILK